MEEKESGEKTHPKGAEGLPTPYLGRILASSVLSLNEQVILSKAPGFLEPQFPYLPEGGPRNVWLCP